MSLHKLESQCQWKILPLRHEGHIERALEGVGYSLPKKEFACASSGRSESAWLQFVRTLR